MAGENDTEQEVGYAKPPKSSQFQPGKSGNKGGRPKGAKNKKTILKEIANEVHTVTLDGCKQRLTTLELLFVQLRTLALSGDPLALDAFNDWNSKFAAEATEKLTVGLWLSEGYYCPEDSPLSVSKVEDDPLTVCPPQAPMELT